MQKCSECDGELIKDGVMHSGNSKYQVYKCNKCGKEKMECLGLN
ncbi:MAG: hypothetical protein V1729_05125 [Candidatus Woesearchaeota archaeon]